MTKVLAPILFFMIAIGIFFSYLKPAYSELQVSKARVESLEQVNQQIEELLSDYTTLREKKSAISAKETENLLKILPDSIDAVHLILDLDSLATKHNLIIRSFKVPEIESEITSLTKKTNSRDQKTTTEEDDLLKSAVLTIECTGTYESFKLFLNDIEKSLSLMDIVKLNISVPELLESSKPEKEITYTLDLQIYWLKEIE